MLGYVKGAPRRYAVGHGRPLTEPGSGRNSTSEEYRKGASIKASIRRQHPATVFPKTAVLQRPLEPEQYTSAEFARFCAGRRIRTSVGNTGVSWGNAAAESFFASLKNEMYYRQSFPTRARARFAVAEYIEVFYNRQRLHSTLNYRTPAEALNQLTPAATAA